MLADRDKKLGTHGHNGEANLGQLTPRQTFEVCDGARSQSVRQFQLAATTFGSRRARDLYRRLAGWRPAYWPLVLSFLVDLVAVSWFTMPTAAGLAWPLTVLWTWPIFTSFVGIAGVRRTRKALRVSKARWSGHGLTRTGDSLVVVVSTVG